MPVEGAQAEGHVKPGLRLRRRPAAAPRWGRRQTGWGRCGSASRARHGLRRKRPVIDGQGAKPRRADGTDLRGLCRTPRLIPRFRACDCSCPEIPATQIRSGRKFTLAGPMVAPHNPMCIREKGWVVRAFNRVMGGKPAQASAALAMITALIAVPTGSAKATESDCDSFITSQFKIIGSGASFQAYGRSVNLLNDDTFNHSFTYISSGYQFGDLVWVDRSLNPMSSNVPTYFSDDSYVTSRAAGSSVVQLRTWRRYRSSTGTPPLRNTSRRGRASAPGTAGRVSAESGTSIGRRVIEVSSRAGSAATLRGCAQEASEAPRAGAR